MNAVQRDIHGSPMLPDAMEAEQALLGALLMKNDCMEAIPPSFDAAYFDEDLHRKMFVAMLELRSAGKSFSPITLKEKLPPSQQVGGLTVSQYMARLMSESVGYFNVPDWCAAITSAAARREIRSLSADLSQIAFEDELKIPDDIAAVRARLAEVTQSLMGEDGADPEQAADEYLTAITGGGQGTGEVAGVPVCLPELHAVLSDPFFRARRLYGLLSSSGEGKTALTLQIIYTALMAGHPVQLLSYDQTRTECVAQMAAQVLSVEFRRQLENSPYHPLLNQSEVDECYAFVRKIFALPFDVIDCKTDDTVEKLCTYATRFCKKNKNGKTPLIVIDHIGVIKPEDPRADEGTKAKVIGQRLKSLAKDLHAAVLVLQQRSGTGMKRNNPRPVAADLFGGEAARQPFDAIFYLYRPEVHMAAQLDTAEDDRDTDKIRARFNQSYARPFGVPIEGTGELGCLKLRFGDKSIKRHVDFEASYTRYKSRRAIDAQERFL